MNNASVNGIKGLEINKNILGNKQYDGITTS